MLCKEGKEEEVEGRASKTGFGMSFVASFGLDEEDEEEGVEEETEGEEEKEGPDGGFGSSFVVLTL